MSCTHDPKDDPATSVYIKGSVGEFRHNLLGRLSPLLNNPNYEPYAPMTTPTPQPAPTPESPLIGGFRITPDGLIMNGPLPPTKQETADYLEHERADLIAALDAKDRLIADQQQLLKERQEWALHTNEVIADLRAQLAALQVAAKKDGELLGEIGTVLKERAVGHAILYSDRVTGFIKRIDAARERKGEGR